MKACENRFDNKCKQNCDFIINHFTDTYPSLSPIGSIEKDNISDEDFDSYFTDESLYGDAVELQNANGYIINNEVSPYDCEAEISNNGLNDT
jgi:hypothetical protein